MTVRGFSGPQERGVTLHPIFVIDYAREHAELDHLRQLVEDGLVTLRVAQTLPAEKATEAHHILELGGTRGRLVLEF